MGTGGHWERTRDVMQYLKAQGQVSSRPVFEDTAILAWMRADRLAGCSYEGIAERLNAAGTPTTRGGRWQGNMVRWILLRTAPRTERRVA
jgi:hypothetical protein